MDGSENSGKGVMSTTIIEDRKAFPGED